MENLSLLLLFAKKSIFAFALAGIVSFGGLSKYYTSSFEDNNDSKRIEMKVGETIGSKDTGRAWWSWFF